MAQDVEQPRLHKQLAGHPFLRGLSSDDVAVFVELGEVVEFDIREMIFRAGDQADRFFLLRTGVVSLTVDAGGSFPGTIELLSEGSALGWSWLFEPYQWQFDAIAQTPVRGVVFDAAGLLSRFEEDPSFGYRVMMRIAEVIATRLHATRRQVLNLSG